MTIACPIVIKKKREENPGNRHIAYKHIFDLNQTQIELKIQEIARMCISE